MYADFNFLENENIIYSVDMLRLKTKITYEEFTKIEFMINTVYKDNIKDTYISNNVSSFKYNYVMEKREGVSFWIGYLHNSEKINNPNSLQNCNSKYNLTIEFNPNKVPLEFLIKYILSFSNDWTIKSLDMAIDLKINILDLCRT